MFLSPGSSDLQQCGSSVAVVEWLGSNSLMSVITASMADVVAAMQKAKNGGRDMGAFFVIYLIQHNYYCFVFRTLKLFFVHANDSTTNLGESKWFVKSDMQAVKYEKLHIVP